ncbi:calcium-dependent protein kinase 10 [Nematostella vectensis]|uniref:calcium-dependent protein kinase 10 n=1 Tax=Nematostella vectensis TaxID=45351 RepID=UPI00139061FD|nr:calcium-dependent protein kinase 10 [Nematostella vectensis]
MLRRQYSSIAEEPENEDDAGTRSLTFELETVREQPTPQELPPDHETEPEDSTNAQREPSETKANDRATKDQSLADVIPNSPLSPTIMSKITIVEDSENEVSTTEDDEVFVETTYNTTNAENQDKQTAATVPEDAKHEKHLESRHKEREKKKQIHNSGENLAKTQIEVPKEVKESIRNARKTLVGSWQRDISRTPSPVESVKEDMELTESQVREIKEAFLVFDDNGDGCITATELKKLVTSLGYNITEAELMDMMNQIDSDGNGAIDFPEFLQLMTKNLQDADPDDTMQETFRVFDRDNNNSIGVEEVQRVLKLLGQDFKDYEVEAMLQGADYDGDGTVGFDDFSRLMSS